MDEQELLQEAIQNNIIDISHLRIAVDDMKKKELLSQHTFAITQGKDGRWSTRVVLDDGTKVVRHRKTREELEQYLINFYKEKQEAIYIDYVYHTWMNEKLEYGEIKKQSYDRYNSEFERFFTKDCLLMSKKFKNISELDLECFIKTTIRDLGLTRKAYSGLVTLLNGIFKYGKKLGLTQISISSFIKDLYFKNDVLFGCIKSLLNYLSMIYVSYQLHRK